MFSLNKFLKKTKNKSICQTIFFGCFPEFCRRPHTYILYFGEIKDNIKKKKKKSQANIYTHDGETGTHTLNASLLSIPVSLYHILCCSVTTKHNSFLYKNGKMIRQEPRNHYIESQKRQREKKRDSSIISPLGLPSISHDPDDRCQLGCHWPHHSALLPSPHQASGSLVNMIHPAADTSYSPQPN